ncbi:MAG: DUF4403 family protein [Polymorphobacter sp.]
MTDRRWLLALALLLAGCGGNDGNPAPPRLTAAADVPVRQSHVVVPVSLEIPALEARLNAEIPKSLYKIDRQESACVAGQRIGKTKVTPDIGCRIVGTVTRGPIRLSGEGKTLQLAMPITAEVSARNIGKIIKSETATGAAIVRADIKLDMTPDWRPLAKVSIDYDWTEKPGVELLGQRFTFAGKADDKLATVIAKLEADIPRHLQALHPRDRLEKAWASGFTSVELNKRNPPVWLRITPQQLSYGGYRVENGQIILALAVDVGTETFVGNRPADPTVTRLPALGKLPSGGGFAFEMPVVADYDQLEPVLAKALGKLAKKGLTLPELGAVKLEFGKVTMYATDAGKLAIGLQVDAAGSRGLVSTKGTVWLTGVPYNQPDSQRILVRDLTVTGTADSPSGRLLLAIAKAPAVQAEIATAVSHDFAGDFAKLMVKVDKALTDKRLGAFVLNAKIESVSNGNVQPLGQGLYMPVTVRGKGDLRFSPKI